jgi:polysaccharide biosynthesis/export protein
MVFKRSRLCVLLMGVALLGGMGCQYGTAGRGVSRGGRTLAALPFHAAPLRLQLASAVAPGDANAAAQLENPALRPKAGAYRLLPGDAFDLQCFNDPSLSRRGTVRQDGFMSLPVAGDVLVAGLKRGDAEARIAEAYKHVFREPRFALSVTQLRGRSSLLLGNVALPGRYPCAEPTDLATLLHQAGGYDRAPSTPQAQWAWLYKAMVVREFEGGHHVLCYDLNDVDAAVDPASKIAVFPGDLVILPEVIPLVYVRDLEGRWVAVQHRAGARLLETAAGAGVLNLLAGQRKLSAALMLFRTSETITAYDVDEASAIILEAGDSVHVVGDAAAASEISSAGIEDLHRRAALGFYSAMLGVRGLEWIDTGGDAGRAEAVGRLPLGAAPEIELLLGIR